MYTETEVKDTESRARAIFCDALHARTSRWPGHFPEVTSPTMAFSASGQSVAYMSYHDVTNAPNSVVAKAFKDGLATFLAQVDERIQQWYMDRLHEADLLERLARSL